MWLRFLASLASLANRITAMIERRAIKQDGKNEANLEQRIEQDESKERAEAIYDRPDINRIAELRNKSDPKD